jgi:hypothetical protein
MTPLLRKYPRPVQEVVPRCRDWRSFITAPAVLSSASVVSVATMDSYRLQVRHDGKRVRLLTHPGYAVLWIPEGDLARTVDETAAVAKRVAYSVAMKAQAAPVSPQDRSRTRSLLSSMIGIGAVSCVGGVAVGSGMASPMASASSRSSMRWHRGGRVRNVSVPIGTMQYVPPCRR